jgi:riboflavin biosynthesis pyrimidine reductase
MIMLIVGASRRRAAGSWASDDSRRSAPYPRAKSGCVSAAPAGGPHLAAQAFKAGLVDECHLFITPIVVGGGKQALADDVRLELELLDERRFGSGMVYLRYRVRT